MLQMNKDRWNVAKTKGFWRFALLYGVVLWGSVMFMLRFILDYFVWHRYWDLELTLTHIISLAVIGFSVGLVGWVVNRAKYN